MGRHKSENSQYRAEKAGAAGLLVPETFGLVRVREQLEGEGAGRNDWT